MKKLSLVAGLLLAFSMGAVAAENPQTDASDRNFDTNQPNSIPGGIQKAEDGANRGLNKVDRGVHKGIHKTKKGAHKAHTKMKEGVDKAMEPAHEPEPVVQ